MILKLRQLQQARPAIDNFSTKALKAKTAYSVAKNRRLILTALKPYDEAIDELIHVHGKAPEDGSPPQLNLFSLAPELRVEVTKQIDDLLDVEEEIAIRLISGAELETTSLTPNDLDALEFMIEIPEGWK